MEEVFNFFVRHGSMVLFWAVFAEQIGLPLPAAPLFLLAAGALAGAGKMSLAAAISLAVVASLAGDLIWYYLGRHRGRQVLNMLCRISLEPDSCVRRTENYYIRHGVRSLLIVKFIPGLGTVTPALAGLFKTGIPRFLLYDGLGSLIWIIAFIAPGYFFSNQLEKIASQVAELGSLLALLLVGSLAAYIVYKYIHRQRLLRELRIARITVDELKQMLDAGEKVVIVDLRQPLDVAAAPYVIPGALRISVEELGHRHQEIDRDRDVILYCACPNEATSARMALLLRKKGIAKVRPLIGGVEAWRERNFPVEEQIPVGIEILQ
jgi:membrane protein DedA with SNARE-associated domain/rhodanese-related sulfurtransferase